MTATTATTVSNLPAMQRDMMKAIVQDTYGSADVLDLREIPKPDISADEVLVRVHAAGVDRGVWHRMTGLPYPIRPADSGMRTLKHPIAGGDLAGVVEAVGSDVTRFKVGAEVFGIGEGTYAEYARAPENKLAHKPPNVSFEHAGVAGVSALTALQAVRDHGKVASCQKVLIIGASGGVGTFAVQIAKFYGAEVTGVCSTSKMTLVASIGADHVIDYTKDDFAEKKCHYDVILDMGGNSRLSRLRRALAPKGTLILVGGEGGGKWLGGMGRTIGALMLSVFATQKLGAFICKENAEDLMVIAGLMQSGQVTPVIDHTYFLSEAPEAIRNLEDGKARGKLAISI